MSFYVCRSIRSFVVSFYIYLSSFCNVSRNSFSLSTSNWGNVMSRRTLKCESSDTM